MCLLDSWCSQLLCFASYHQFSQDNTGNTTSVCTLSRLGNEQICHRLVKHNWMKCGVLSTACILRRNIHAVLNMSHFIQLYYSDVIMSAKASQTTRVSIVCSTICRRSKKQSKLRVTGLCEGNPPVTGGLSSQRASNAENASIWWSFMTWPGLAWHKRMSIILNLDV